MQSDSADASVFTFADAAPRVDARNPPVLLPDAAVTSTTDSGLPGGLFCANNAACTTAGTCCFFGFCVPGDPVGDLCFPSE
jgi:hypothetical protein